MRIASSIFVGSITVLAALASPAFANDSSLNSHANANAQAAQIYAQAFNKDAQFYDFWRAMKSYQTTFLNNAPDKGETSIILSPQNSYLKQFVGQR